MNTFILDFIYILSALSFVFGIKLLGKPATAKRGNLIAAAGMTAAIVSTIFLYDGILTKNYIWIFGALITGTVIGTLMAKQVQMTQMPQMVSFFNGMGGACAALISIVEYDHALHNGGELSSVRTVILLLGLVIGALSFSGSMVAYGKLEGKIKDFRIPSHQLLQTLFLVVIIGLLIGMATGALENSRFIYLIFALSLIYGVFFVLPIGGADMPVVISLLNSFTGVATAFGGFLYDNKVMLFGGILVGSAGTLLTIVMCKAMNRSLMSVLVGGFGTTPTSTAVDGGSSAIVVKEVGAEEAAVIFDSASSVIIVPGYGMAVAQAQHIIKELMELLEKKNINVRFAIHPVAGRMPGHMNVLLAESNVPYDKLIEMDNINDDFANTDVVIVVGANDVVNPAARTNTSSPIYGMPILNVDKARTVIVSKRSMASGYAGIENELFGYPNCLMLFGDAKASLTKVVGALKEM